MTRFVRRHAHRLLVSSLVLALLVALPRAGQGPRAHDELPAHHKILPENATAVMRAFQEDLQAPQALAAVTSVPCSGGFADSYPCSNVDLEAFLPLADIGGIRSNSAANDIWGWTDPQDGKEYAIIGRVFGTSFVDISDPADPIYLGELVTHGAFGSSWRDIKVYADHAFIVSEAKNHGMQVFDLTQLRGLTSETTFSETAHYKGVASAHNIAINEDTGYAYIVGVSGKGSCNGGLHMVDISTPTSPTSAGCFGGDGYTHDAQCVVYHGPDMAYQGQEICFNANEDTVTVVDVTDKAAPVELSSTGYGGVAYIHQGWLTPDHGYFIQDDELDEVNFGGNTRTRIWDVSDLTSLPAPVVFNGMTSAIDHNLYTKGSFAYEANYRSGLSILDISNPTAPSEVAYFDTYPGSNAPQFNGAWSNYPYFDSGIVIVSGIEQGLFILRPILGPIDNPPSVDITNPGDGSDVIGSVPVEVSAGDTEDAEGTLLVEWNIDGGTWQSTTYDFGTMLYQSDADWDSTLVGDGPHTINARAVDSAGNTSTSSNGVTVDNVASVDVHIGDLDGGGVAGGRGGRWNATATAAVHLAGDGPVANATVSGSWSNGASGSGSCVTNAAGQCSITKTNVKRNQGSVTFTVDDVASGTDTYDAGANHDPDGDSNGTTIVILAP